MKTSISNLNLKQGFNTCRNLAIVYQKHNLYQQLSKNINIRHRVWNKRPIFTQTKICATANTSNIQKQVEVDSIGGIQGEDCVDFLRQQKLDQGQTLQGLGTWSNQIFKAACQISAKGQKFADVKSEISVLITDNKTISALNKKYLGKDGPTDVLSFSQLEEDEDAALATSQSLTLEDLQIPLDHTQEAAMTNNLAEFSDIQRSGAPDGLTGLEGEEESLILGDVVISVEKAYEQAQERGHSLETELQILLAHGILHLMGYDHEKGAEASAEMSQMENQIFSLLNWPQKGLVSQAAQKLRKDKDSILKLYQLRAVADPIPTTKKGKTPFDETRGKIKVVAIDLDGTLLNSSSEVLQSTVHAIKTAMSKGIKVMIATGKCRTAAFGILKKHGLSGKNQVVDFDGPGIYINGAASFDKYGRMIPSESIPRQLTQYCFEYSDQHDISLVSFEGDVLTTQKMTPENLRVHTFYHEPKPIVKSVQSIIKGDPSKKLLFTGDPKLFKTQLRPDLKKFTRLYNAVIVQPMPHMLEVLTQGQSKWKGARAILKSMGLKGDNMMMFGDGENDIDLIKNCGLGVAMANGQPEVLQAADYVTKSNDDDGIAEAFEKFLL